MAEASLDTLLLSGECDVHWGTRGFSTVHRTVEIHSTNLLYCFVEPKNSMAKHVKEKVYLEGCHVVDGGAHSGECERLLLFLVNYDYAEKVDLLGNRRAFIFDSAEDRPASADDGVGAGFPSGNYVVQLFLTDKMLKWRLLQAIQLASQEYAQVFPDSPAAGGLANSSVLKGTTGSGSGGSFFAGASVPNHFELKVLGCKTAAAAPPAHARQSSEVSVLSDHEVLQLSDVLREYEAMQQQRAASGSNASLHVAQEDTRRAAEAAEEEMLDDGGEKSCALGTTARVSSFSGAVPARLQHSLLFETCICGNSANQTCADCGAAFPSWCLLQPFGAFVCIECIGVHRKLWSNKCRGAELDLWPAADVAFMQTRGNAVVNAELEYYVAFPADSVEAAMHMDPPVKPVASFSSIDVRESYIQWKYEERLFTQTRHPDASQPLPPRPDPAGLEQSRPSVALASIGGAVATTAGANRMTAQRKGERHPSDSFFNSSSQQHQQQLQQRAFLRDDGPPRYAGVLDVIVKELVGPEFITGAVCVLTNGFQTLRTQAGRQLLHMRHSTAWDEHLQLGIEGKGRRPLYCTIYRGKGELLATGEVWLKEEVFQPCASSMFAVTLTWSQLHKKTSQRSTTERWKVTFLTSYQVLL